MSIKALHINIKGTCPYCSANLTILGLMRNISRKTCYISVMTIVIVS